MKKAILATFQIGPLASVVVCVTLVLPLFAVAQTAPPIPSITTPDKVQTSIGTLE
jgi:hypothetical protein